MVSTKSILAASAVATLVIAAPQAPRLTEIQFSGNGCPQDGSKPIVQASGSTLDFTFPEFFATIGAGQDVMQRTKNCQAHINFDSGVEGFALQIRKITSQGFVVLTPGTTATVLGTVFWSNDAATTANIRDQVVNNGTTPTFERVKLEDDVPELPSQCVDKSGDVGILNINWRVSFTAPGGEGFGLFSGDEDFPVAETVELEWVPCKSQEVKIEIPELDK